MTATAERSHEPQQSQHAEVSNALLTAVSLIPLS